MQNKMAAQQEAQKADYELQKQQTLAKSAVATATGEANSKLIRAEAEAKSNKLLQQTLTPGIIQYKAIEKWDGELPTFTGSGVPIIDLKGLGSK